LVGRAGDRRRLCIQRSGAPTVHRIIIIIIIIIVVIVVIIMIIMITATRSSGSGGALRQ